MEKNMAIAIHGGAGEDSSFIRIHKTEYEVALCLIVQYGYKILEKDGSAVDAVEACVAMMEDNILFNCGRGAALNSIGAVEMDAAIMNGANLRSGGVCTLNNVKNPIKVARHIMEQTNHILFSGKGALEIAKQFNSDLEPDSYFITDHQLEDYLGSRDSEKIVDMLLKKTHGTVGAVALDHKGNLAAATSTGGTANCLPGRVGDSCIIGAGCYANKLCAVSGTGTGELLIRGVTAHTVSLLIELTGCTVQEACDIVVHSKNNKDDGDVGVISIDKYGNIGCAYNSERMHRAWRTSSHPLKVNIYESF